MNDKMKEYLTQQLVKLSLAVTAEDKLEVLNAIYNAGYDTCMYEHNL